MTDALRRSLLVGASFFMIQCATLGGRTRPIPPFAGLSGPVVIAHRGGALEAPENTLEAVRHAVAVGADWVEVDVTLTKDDEVVVIHDDTLDRTTNGRGYVRDHTLDELEALVANRASPGGGPSPIADFSQAFPNARVPTLDALLSLPDVRFMVELKQGPPSLVPAVVAIVAKHHAHDRVVVGSFDPELVWQVYNLDPSIPLIGIAEEEHLLERFATMPVTAVGVSLTLAPLALAMAPAGVAVWTWTVTTTEQAEELTLRGVHGLITDIPAQVVALLRTPAPLRLSPSELP